MIIKPENWKPVGGLTLEPNALLATKEAISSVALTAGPGAGKTELLAQRADFLLRTNNCPYPKRIDQQIKIYLEKQNILEYSDNHERY